MLSLEPVFKAKDPPSPPAGLDRPTPRGGTPPLTIDPPPSPPLPPPFKGPRPLYRPFKGTLFDLGGGGRGGVYPPPKYGAFSFPTFWSKKGQKRGQKRGRKRDFFCTERNNFSTLLLDF